VQDDDPDADFGAALAQTADASPATATPAATRVKGGDNIWRTLAAISDEAKAPQRAAGDLQPTRQREAVAAPALSRRRWLPNFWTHMTPLTGQA